MSPVSTAARRPRTQVTSPPRNVWPPHSRSRTCGCLLYTSAARESAARALIGEDAAVLREPNDILGVEYCKALLQSGSTIAPLAILRKVVGHNGGAAKGFASASHIRELLTNGEDASAYLTAESAAIYARECAAGRAPVTRCV